MFMHWLREITLSPVILYCFDFFYFFILQVENYPVLTIDKTLHPCLKVPSQEAVGRESQTPRGSNPASQMSSCPVWICSTLTWLLLPSLWKRSAFQSQRMSLGTLNHLFGFHPSGQPSWACETSLPPSLSAEHWSSTRPQQIPGAPQRSSGNLCLQTPSTLLLEAHLPAGPTHWSKTWHPLGV